MQLDPSRRPIADLAGDLQHGSPVEASRSCAEILRRFEPLFRKYWQRLRSGAQSSGIEYEDFLQEIAKKMAGSITGLRNPHAFPGYLQRIVMTTTVEVMRQASRAISPHDLGDLIGHARDEGSDILVVGSYLAQLPLREALATVRSRDRLCGISGGSALCCWDGGTAVCGVALSTRQVAVAQR